MLYDYVLYKFTIDIDIDMGTYTHTIVR